MTKKILVIIASPRKGNTFEACEILRTKIEKDMPVEYEYLWLKDMNLLPCKGCFTCFCQEETACPNRDDAPLIRRKMLEADCIIFAGPVYVMNVTGLMKNFMDRFGYIGHRPPFHEKKAVVLVNTASGGLKSVLKYMNKIIRVWGFEVVSKIGLLAPPDPDSLSPSRLKNADSILTKAALEITSSFKRARRKIPGLYEVGFFHVWRGFPSMLEKYYPYDYQYWKEKGWFEPGLKYYVDVPVNPIYLAIARLAGWLTKQLNKENRGRSK